MQLGRRERVLGSLLAGSAGARRANPAKQNMKYQLQPPLCISPVGAVGVQKRQRCAGLDGGAAWEASKEHPRVPFFWGSAAPNPPGSYQVPHLQDSADSMVRCHLESRASPLAEGTGGTRGGMKVAQVRV